MLSYTTPAFLALQTAVCYFRSMHLDLLVLVQNHLRYLTYYRLSELATAYYINRPGSCNIAPYVAFALHLYLSEA